MMPPNIKAEVQWRYRDDLLISVALLEPHTLMMLSRSITLISKQGKSSLLLLSPFSCVQLCATPQMTPTRLPHPWDFPGKNTGVCCHFPLQCMKVKSESEVAQSCLYIDTHYKSDLWLLLDFSLKFKHKKTVCIYINFSPRQAEQPERCK